MKIVLNKTEKKPEIKFPCLMISSTSDTIVLFFDNKEGTVVWCLEDSSTDCEVGEYYDGWNMNIFSPYTGTVTLSND